MLSQFQSLYPNGSIISELIQIFQGKYIVRVSLQVEGVTRATGMAGADTIEAAEDQARNRALMVLGTGNSTATVAFSTKTLKNSTNTTNIVNESVPVIPASSDVVSSHRSFSNHTETSSPPVAEQNIQPREENYYQVPPQSVPTTATREEKPDTSKPNLEMVSSPEPEPQLLPEITPSNVTPFTPRNNSQPEDTGVYSGIGTRRKKSEPVNLSDVIAQTDVHIERLGWTKEQGREHLKKTYGKLGRSLLSEEELLDFLNYLKAQPDPIAGF
jgi:hypothetical protein